VGYAVLIAASVFACIVLSRSFGVPAERAMTMNFMALSLTQVLHLGNARSAHPVATAASALSNRAAVAAVAVVLMLPALTIFVGPLARLLHVTWLTPQEWLVVLVVGVVPVLVGQAIKARPHLLDDIRRRALAK
jgi:Ca2+-transporting ATPase